MILLNKKKLKLEDLKTIDDIKNAKNLNKNISAKDKRNVKILFLDDEGFDTELLINLGYLDVQKMYEYKQMDEFEKYDIIFCDINGVAKNLNEEFQGAALAKMIKQTYPDKIVVIFSAKQQYLSFNKFADFVDDVIYKNIPISELTEKIDHYINIIINPVDFWENIKKQLYKSGVNSKEISLIENYYVKSILERKDYQKEIKEIALDTKLEAFTAIVNSLGKVISLYLSFKQ